jgi:hypothetical protein
LDAISVWTLGGVGAGVTVRIVAAAPLAESTNLRGSVGAGTTEGSLLSVALYGSVLLPDEAADDAAADGTQTDDMTRTAEIATLRRRDPRSPIRRRSREFTLPPQVVRARAGRVARVAPQ